MRALAQPQSQVRKGMTSPAASKPAGPGPAAHPVARLPAAMGNQAAQRLLRSPGEPLDPALRAFMEPRFGRDFSRVRVHRGPEAERSAAELSARAFTTGHDIAFGAARFQPATSEGRKLIAHELAHVVQQAGGRGPGPHVVQRAPDEPKDKAEAEELVKKGTWCRDSERTGRLHPPSQQCYREIPPSEGYEGAKQSCFDKESGQLVEPSDDEISPVSGQLADGTCDIPAGPKDPPNPFTKRGRRALGHGVADVCAEDPKLCGTIYGGLSGVGMGIALPKELGLGSLAYPALLGTFSGLAFRYGLPLLDRVTRKRGFLPTLSFGLGTNAGLGVGIGFEKRNRPVPKLPFKSYLTLSFDSSLALTTEPGATYSFLAKVGLRVDPGKQGGFFGLGAVGGGLATGGTQFSGAASAEVGLGYRAADFFDVQVVRETVTGGPDSGSTYWLTVKVVAPRRVLEKHK